MLGIKNLVAFLLVRSEGNLEKALAPLGYRVEWIEFFRRASAHRSSEWREH